MPPTRAGKVAFDDWVARARAVPIEDEITRRGISVHRQGKELVGPCPKCGGTERFSINASKGVWNCRHCEKGGDVIELVKHLDGCEFLDACETLIREPPPKPNGKDRTGEPRKVVVAEFPYEDQNGAVAFVIERIEYQNPDGSWVLTKDGKHKKTFRRKRPDPDRPGRWIWNGDGAPIVPYRLGELTEAIAKGYGVVIVEGEAKVDLLWSWNVPATCCAGGAKKWCPEHSAFLKGADVVILPDHDAVGNEHVEVVASSLQGIAASIRTLELPGLSRKDDILDWARDGGTVEKLIDLIEREAKPWTPEKLEEADATLAPQFSDEALALLFAERHAEGLRFVAFRSRWLFWERSRWIFDDTLAAFDYARAICREQAARCRKAKTASALASAKTVAAVEKLAKADRRLAATGDQWDRDDDIINTPTDTP